MPGRRHDLHAHRHGANLDFDFAIIQLAFAQHFAKSLPGIVVFRRRPSPVKPRLGPRQQNIQHPVLRRVGGAVAHLGHFLFSRHFDGDVDKIADDRINFAANIAHFREFGGFDLDEGRLGEPGQAASRSRSCRRRWARS